MSIMDTQPRRLDSKADQVETPFIRILFWCNSQSGDHKKSRLRIFVTWNRGNGQNTTWGRYLLASGVISPTHPPHFDEQHGSSP